MGSYRDPQFHFQATHLVWVPSCPTLCSHSTLPSRKDGRLCVRQRSLKMMARLKTSCKDSRVSMEVLRTLPEFEMRLLKTRLGAVSTGKHGALVPSHLIGYCTAGSCTQRCFNKLYVCGRETVWGLGGRCTRVQVPVEARGIGSSHMELQVVVRYPVWVL